MPPETPRSARRRKGIARNVANQLVQIAVGWRTIEDGPLLATEPRTGRYTIDITSASAQVNTRPAELWMTLTLRQWLGQELDRLGHPAGWVRRATVEVIYAHNDALGKAVDVGLTALATADTDFGVASATYANQLAWRR